MGTYTMSKKELEGLYSEGLDALQDILKSEGAENWSKERILKQLQEDLHDV